MDLKLGKSAFIVSGALLLAGLSACEHNKVPARPLSDSSTSFSYDAGYEAGVVLAQLQQKKGSTELEKAIQGLCDALEESGTQFKGRDFCQMLESDPGTTANTRTVGGADSKAVNQQSVAKKSAFLAEDDYADLNARRAGVVVLPSTVQYEVINEGDGEKPGVSDSVIINYEATLPNGLIFDTTYEDGEPLNLKLDEIAIPGLREILMLMPAGSLWRVVIPPEMGFGRSGNNRLRRRVVIYEIELISIQRP